MYTLHDETFDGIADLMHDVAGLSFAGGKKPLISSRLTPRIERLGLGGFEDYLQLLAGDAQGDELQVAVDLLTTNETYFFREQAHYDLLQRELQHARPRAFHAWSAAASFGDESYSLAMLLSDLQRQGAVGDDWSVLGTDISDRVLRGAVEGVYPRDRLRHVDEGRLKRHCLRGEGESEGLVRMGDHLRAHVRFGHLNLCRPIEPLGPFDAVFLRNVLIYFDAPTKRDVVQRVLQRLRPGGLFFLGIAEGRAPDPDGVLEPLAPGAFRKR